MDNLKSVSAKELYWLGKVEVSVFYFEVFRIIKDICYIIRQSVWEFSKIDLDSCKYIFLVFVLFRIFVGFLIFL